MAISFATGAGANGTLVSATVNPGDLVVLFAVRDGSTVPGAFSASGLTIAAGVTGNSGGVGGESTRITSVVIPSTVTAGTSIQFTSSSATWVSAMVYRTDLAGGTMSVGTPTSGGATSTTITFPALTLATPSGGSSWVYAAVGTAGSLSAAPSGLTQRASAFSAYAAYDSAGSVSSWAAKTMTQPSSQPWRSHSIEIRETPAAGPPPPPPPSPSPPVYTFNFA